MALRDASAGPIWRRAEATEQMRDPRQRDHNTQDGKQECRSNVRHEHDRAGHGPDRTGCER